MTKKIFFDLRESSDLTLYVGGDGEMGRWGDRDMASVGSWRVGECGDMGG
ncbi:MAG: hypothetical protein F6K48_01685 [Okeania sp. SIO3H1]|nr:hypothetical protein [Okeania sp. SIO3H1]